MEKQDSDGQTSVGVTKYIIGLIVIGILIIVVSLMSIKKNPLPQENIGAGTIALNTVATSSPLTLEEVAKHNNADSCYSAIRGSVYDLTSWVYRHPGGSARILSICGKDGTSAFTTQHAGEPRPEQMLATFKIGELVK